MQNQTAKKNGTWTKTRLKNLLRHKSGRYYARAYVGGKEVWQPLGTSHFSVAEAKLAKFLEQYRSVRRRGATIASAKMTFDEAAKMHLENLNRNVKIKQRTREYWGETLTALYKSWPELRPAQLRNIRQTDLEEWAGDYAKTASATRYNNTVHLVRHILCRHGGRRAGPQRGKRTTPHQRETQRAAAAVARAIQLPASRDAGRAWTFF